MAGASSVHALLLSHGGFSGSKEAPKCVSFFYTLGGAVENLIANIKMTPNDALSPLKNLGKPDIAGA
ncbi:MAG: hypothetical protein NTV43_04965 [Methylococcales bacterium]|nr:hypothetical protein [Methylococcales bacterium]